MVAELHGEATSMDALAWEYGKTSPGDPRGADIANEISELCLILSFSAYPLPKRAPGFWESRRRSKKGAGVGTQ